MHLKLDRPEPEKERFYDQLQYAVAKVSATEILIPIVDWNGHFGAPAIVFCDAHGGHGFRTHNTEGERILEFAIANGLCVGNTWFKNRDTHLITYSSDGIKKLMFTKPARKFGKPDYLPGNHVDWISQ